MESVPKVYEAINRVQAAIAKVGIGKDRRNEQQGYKFRGIDDVYNALSPVLAEHKLCILPRILSREVVERVNARGTALFSVTVEAEFDLVSTEDGSKHTVRTFGEAMDSGDKATNKAMSAAYKYACMQAFAIPTEGDNDADSTTHEVEPQRPAKMMPNERANLLGAIEAAATLGDLQRAFSPAYKRALDLNDYESLDLLIEAKDRRKAILSQDASETH